MPTRIIRNRTRAGVTTTVVTSRAASLTGTMSPYPVVVTETVA